MANSCVLFVWISEQKSDYFPININWLVVYNSDIVCLLRGTDWGLYNVIHFNLSLKKLVVDTALKLFVLNPALRMLI
jgi:hypothetical protein